MNGTHISMYYLRPIHLGTFGQPALCGELITTRTHHRHRRAFDEINSIAALRGRLCINCRECLEASVRQFPEAG